MKRSGITTASSGLHGAGATGPLAPAPSRVARLKQLLKTDLVLDAVFPEEGPVQAFFEDDSFVRRPQDEQAIIDWCVQNTAPNTLTSLIDDWQRDSLCLKGCQGPFMIEEALSAALNQQQPLQRFSLIDCAPLDGGNRNDPERTEDSADDCDRIVTTLSHAAWSCNEIVLERCSLFSSTELQEWLQNAAESCALQRLGLCAVSGFDGTVMQQLATLLMNSQIQSLQLGQLSACDAQSGQVLAQAIGSSALHHLGLTDVDPDFLQALLGALAKLPGQCPGQLATLHVQLSIQRREQPLRAEQQLQAVQQALDALRQRFPNLQIDARIAYRGALDDARITDRPRFLLQLGRFLWLFKRAEALAAVSSQGSLLRVLPPEAALRVAFYLSEGKGSALSWVQLIDQHHHQLWQRAYVQGWRRQLMAPERVVEGLERLLARRDAAGLFARAERLRAQSRTPPVAVLQQLAQSVAKDAHMSACFDLAFDAVRTIEAAAKEGRTADLVRYAGLLRKHGALPSTSQLEPVLELGFDDPELLRALWGFVGE